MHWILFQNYNFVILFIVFSSITYYSIQSETRSPCWCPEYLVWTGSSVVLYHERIFKKEFSKTDLANGELTSQQDCCCLLLGSSTVLVWRTIRKARCSYLTLLLLLGDCLVTYVWETRERYYSRTGVQYRVPLVSTEGESSLLVHAAR